MKNLLVLIATATLFFSSPAFSGGDKDAVAVDEKQLKLGKRAFIRCQACHTLGDGEEHRTGPNLHGLFGAVAGKKEGFVYSDALVKAEIEWDNEGLRAWLKSPSTYIPGNKMAFGGVPSDREMDALMTYLEVKTK